MKGAGLQGAAGSVGHLPASGEFREQRPLPKLENYKGGSAPGVFLYREFVHSSFYTRLY